MDAAPNKFASASGRRRSKFVAPVTAERCPARVVVWWLRRAEKAGPASLPQRPSLLGTSGSLRRPLPNYGGTGCFLELKITEHLRHPIFES